MYIHRDLEKKIIEASKQYPAVMVCGQRQVGKSTMLHHIKEKERKYVTFDDFMARNLALNDPALFIETYGYPLLIDEFQRVPSILLEIKKIIDEKKLNGQQVNGMFWLTGSQKFKMMKGISESLAGRVAIFDMAALSQNEINENSNSIFDANLNHLKKRTGKQKTVHEIFHDIFTGGMPSIVTGEMDREDYYRNYVNTYIERDVRDLSQVGKIDEFYQFLVYMAANTSHELRYDSISKEIGVSAPTIKNWVSILETSGIIYILRPYFIKVTNRLVKTPKFYFMDTGLASYLAKWPNEEVLENGAVSGAFFETYVITEIVKSYYNAGKEMNLYYYRDIDQKEIDLLIVDAQSIYPIEIKKAKNPSNPDKNISALNKFGLKVEPMIVLCMADDLYPLNKNCWLYPVSKI
ncbi:ATP-binding protein [Floccifex sp.]|uniref:ATP-binding protein n=1 Tax=Floccifex sp. TaxID=2815810 RepID=UPI003F08E11A